MRCYLKDYFICFPLFNLFASSSRRSCSYVLKISLNKRWNFLDWKAIWMSSFVFDKVTRVYQWVVYSFLSLLKTLLMNSARILTLSKKTSEETGSKLWEFVYSWFTWKTKRTDRHCSFVCEKKEVLRTHIYLT